MRLLPLLLALSACCSLRDATVPPDPPAAPPAPADPVSEPVQAPPPRALPVDSLPPAALYEQCHARLEGKESDGECSSDADCAKAGCSQEVCLPAALKGDVMTTCEVLPCFGAVQDCGCHEGRCTWTLREALVPTLPRIPMKISE